MTDSEVQPEDRGYRDAVGKVEPYGVDHIPDVERHGHPRQQFTVWFGGNLALAVMLLGFYPVFYGLSLGASIVAVVVGAALGSVAMGVLSAMGARLGVPIQIQARGPLGYLGNFLPVAFVNVFAAAGWTAVNTIFGAWALQELVDVPFGVAAVVITVVQAAIALYGYNMIHRVNAAATVVVGALFVVLTILALGKADWSFGTNPEADFFVGATGGLITMVGFFLAYLLAWIPFASDYSRYLPADTPGSQVALNTALGNFVVVVWLGVLGVLVASFAGQYGPIEGVRELTGGMAWLAMLAVMAATWAPNGLNIYGGALSLLTLRLPVSRQVATLLITGAAFLLALWAHTDVYGKFYDFLLLSGYLIAPYLAVVLLDWFVGGRSDPARVPELYDRSRTIEWGFVAWAAGCLASVPFWVWSRFTGPVAKEFPNAGDLTYYVGAAVAAIVYLLVHRLPPLSGRGRREPPAPEQEELRVVA
jgi:purine-cytosine permease-like protein